MPRFLAIDWEPPKLNVLNVLTAKGKARVEQSLTAPLTQDLTPQTAAALGRAFKDTLAQANMPASPVLVSIGRDKVILKEILIPYVSAHEEPTVVRFQAAKELSEPVSEVVLDYTTLTPPIPGQQTRVSVVVVRRSIVLAMTNFCQAAGLKLHAIVPRPFALAGLLDRKAGTTPSIARGLLVPTGEEVEFSVYQGDRLAWARSLSAGAGLAGDVKKNLMLLTAQKPDLGEVQRIETAGLADLGDVGIPKEPIDPWRETDAKPANPNAFLGALGLAEAAAKPAGLFVNFAAPKEPKPVTDVNQRRKKIAMYAAAVLVPLLLIAFWINLRQKTASIRELEEAKEKLEEDWKRGEQDRIDVAALKDWENTTISWLDELYDVAARLPHAQGFRVTQISATQLRKRNDKFAATLNIHGVMERDQDVLVQQFIEAMRQDPHVKAQSPAYRANEFTVKIDVAARPPVQFRTPLAVPPQPKVVPEPSTEPMTETPPPEEKTDE